MIPNLATEPFRALEMGQHLPYPPHRRWCGLGHVEVQSHEAAVEQLMGSLQRFRRTEDRAQRIAPAVGQRVRQRACEHDLACVRNVWMLHEIASDEIVIRWFRSRWPERRRKSVATSRSRLRQPPGHSSSASRRLHLHLDLLARQRRGTKALNPGPRIVCVDTDDVGVEIHVDI